MFSITTSAMFSAGVSSADWCFRSHILTYGSGFHVRMLGPLSLMNIRDETFEVDNLVLVGVTIMFMWLKPRSHSAKILSSFCSSFEQKFSKNNNPTPFLTENKTVFR
ncbi:hypothetical protein AVEN_19440-1 [Araneus ventricosus]|uniref:Uncharacterized protein n=1 Tax=Araneus ventricosus TaxID=182803 RepID=A0A4Y2C8H3_ARAVE|nr:hypothetical protein AVEN_19440-1 [Araneus ventricosus]